MVYGSGDTTTTPTTTVHSYKTVEDFNEIMTDTKAFFSGIGDKISKSKPTLENCKKLALGGVLKDLEIIKDGDIQC